MRNVLLLAMLVIAAPAQAGLSLDERPHPRLREPLVTLKYRALQGILPRVLHDIYPLSDEAQRQRELWEFGCQRSKCDQRVAGIRVPAQLTPVTAAPEHP